MKCPKCKANNTDTARFCSNCATSLASADDAHPSFTKTLETPVEELTRGTLFAGRYEIIEELGRGGMGAVYRVEDTKAREEIALKVIKPEIAADKKTIDRFRNELTTARKIAHRSVCRMFDLGEDMGTHFITMEYVPGEDLKSFIRRSKRLSIPSAISIAQQVCEGLEEAHRLGVVHRDLKPCNIMIDKEGNARIMDFGIARSLKEKGITGAGVMIGTPVYMSPEQAEAKEVDQRSDIYSLGVILYEMVTGRVPFEGDNALSIAMKHKGEAPKNPRDSNPQIPEDLSEVILKCLEKERENRFQGAGEVRSELEKIERGLPTTQRTEQKRKTITSREITVKLSFKKLLMPALAVIALLVVGLFLWSPWKQKVSTPIQSAKPSLAVTHFDNRTQMEDLDKSLIEMFSINLSQFEGIRIVSQQFLSDIFSRMSKDESEKIGESNAMGVAKEAGVDYMVVGSVSHVGEEIRMRTQLIKVPGGHVLGGEEAKGNNIESVMDMVDELTEKLSEKLGLSRDVEESFKIADVTTNSLEAFSHYQKGTTYLWQWRSVLAAEEFQKAVDIDPEFAAAYAYLSIAVLRNLTSFRNPKTDMTESKEILKRAEQLSHKIREQERMMIGVLKAVYTRDYKKVEELSYALIEKYPDNKLASTFLCTAYYSNGDFLKANDVLEKFLQNHPDDAFAYNLLAYSHAYLNNFPESVSAVRKYIALLPDNGMPYLSAYAVCLITGEYDAALDFLKEGLAKFPKWVWLHSSMGMTYIIMGDVESARSAFELYYSEGPKTPYHEYHLRRYLGWTYLYEGKLDNAYSELEKALDIAQMEKWSDYMSDQLLNLGKILVYQGEYKEAIEAFEKAEKTSWDRENKNFNPYPIFCHYLIGSAHLKSGDFNSAHSSSENMRNFIQEQGMDAIYLGYFYLLNGEIHAAQGNGVAIRESMNRCSGFVKNHTPEYVRLAAVSSVLLNELDNAIDLYQRLKTDASLAGYGNDTLFFYRNSSLSDYNLGKVYELKGDRVKAIEHYEKFLTLWKDADPGLPEVADARERVAGLKGLP